MCSDPVLELAVLGLEADAVGDAKLTFIVTGDIDAMFVTSFYFSDVANYGLVAMKPKSVAGLRLLNNE